MKKVAVGCLLALGVLIAFLILVPVVIIATSGPKSDSVLQLDLRGLILENRPDDFFSRVFAGKGPDFRDYLDALEKAKTDSRINGVLARVGTSTLGFGKVQELRAKVQEFRDTGKWAVAFMETAGEFSPGGSAYHLATAFDEIYFAPPGRLNLIGIRAEVPFIRGTLDKLGIEPDVDAIGEYKTIRNYYAETGFTPEHREVLETLLDRLYGQLLEGISLERGMTREELAAKIDRAPFLSGEALEEGLVDELLFFDEVKERLKERNDGQLPIVEVGRYLKRHRPGSRGRNRIALIYAIGTIIRGRSSYDPFSHEQYLGSSTLGEALQQAREDDRIDAIVLRVDSPGGSSLASELIRREAALAAESKPLVVSMADVGASGAYLFSMPADYLLAEPGTLTGSIGVFAGKFNMRGLYDWIGMTKGVIGRGRNSGFFSTYQNFTPEEREVFERQLRGTYDAFVEQVAEGRGMEVAEVDRLARGRVYTGEEAVELGLIDEIGGLDQAIRHARDLAGIPEAAAVRIEVMPKPKSFLQTLLNRDVSLPPSLRAWVRLIGALPAEVVAPPRPGDLVMPYRIDLD